MALNPDVTVAAIVEREGRFLFVRERVARREVFNQPAGHLEAHESLVEAVVRETLEETGHLFTPLAVTGFYLWRKPGLNRSFLRVAFSGTVGERNNALALDEDILDTHWLSRAELLERQAQIRSPLVLRCLEDYLAGARYPLSVLSHLDGEDASLLIRT